MNTENSLLENETYDFIAREARNLILLILNFTLFVCILYIYPKLDQTELMISLSVGVSIICTFYFYVIAKEISLKTVLPTNAFLLLNICAASITNDIVGYTSAGIVVFLIVTIVTSRIRTPEEKDIIINYSIIGLFISTAIVWYTKINETKIDYLWEIVISQIILAGALYFYLFKKSSSKTSINPLPFLPLLLNVVLIPVFFNEKLGDTFYFDKGSLSLYDKIGVYRDDYSLLLFGIFLVGLYLYALKIKNTSFSTSTVIISAVLLFISNVRLNQFRNDIYWHDSSPYEFISFGDEFFTLSLIYLLYVGLTILVAKQKIESSVPSGAVFSIVALSIAVIFEYVLVIYESTSEYPFLSPLILTIGISAPLMILFWVNNENTRESCLFLQTVGVAFFAFLPGQGLWLASERVDSYISLVFILYFSAIAYLALTNKNILNSFSFYFPILILWFVVGVNFLDIRIPSFVILFSAIIVLSLFAYFAKDNQSSLNLLSSQVVAVLILSYYNFKKLLEIEEMNFVFNETFEDMISSFSGGIESPFITICYLIIQAIIIVKWFTFTESYITKSKVKDVLTENVVSREFYAYLSLSFSVAFLIINMSNENELPVINSVISVVILIVVGLPLLKSELLPESESIVHLFFGLSATAVLLLFVDTSHQIMIDFDQDQEVSLSAITFLIYSAILASYTLKNKKHVSVSAIHLLSVLTFILIVYDMPVNLPIEFAAVSILLLFLYLINVKDDITIAHAAISQCVLLVFLALFQTIAMDRGAALLSEEDLHAFISAIYLIYIGLTTLFVIPSLKSTKAILSGYTIILLVYSILPDRLSVDPIILGIAIFALTYNLIIDFDEAKLGAIPIVQSLGILFSLFYSRRQGEMFSLEWSIVLFAIWASSMMIIWLVKKGAPQVLLNYIAGIFGLSGILSLYLLLRDESDIKILNIYALITILSVSSFLVLFFEIKSRILSSCSRTQVNSAMQVIMIGMALSGMVVRLILPLSSIEWFIARIVFDLFIFLPMLIQSRFHIAWMLETAPIARETEVEGEIVQPLNIDNFRNAIIMGYAIVAIVIGIDSFFSLKFITITLVLWTFPGVFEKVHSTWVATVSSMAAIGFLIYQLPIPPTNDSELEIVSISEFVVYSFILTFVGIMIVIGAFINEKRYKGEPLTSALAVNGASLAIFAVFLPRWISDEAVLGIPADIIGFLPDIMWALIGFAVFLFGYSHNKDALRKFGLAVVYMDFGLALFDVYTTVGSLPIKIFTTALLGILGLIMYYRYVKVDE